MRRGNQRFDYKHFSETGEKIFIEQEDDISHLSDLVDNLTINNTSMAADASAFLAIEAESLGEEIVDYIDEHEVNNSDVNEINTIIQQVEKLRSEYRKKHKQLHLTLKEDYEELYGKSYAKTMNDVKQFLKSADQYKKNIKAVDDQVKNDEDIALEKVLELSIHDVRRSISDLEKEFQADVNVDEDSTLKKRRDEMSTIVKRVNKIPEKIQDLVREGRMKPNVLKEVELLNKRYERLILLKERYISNVNLAVKERELEKQESFESTSLNIKLEKFKGYSSSMDIYTFKGMFEKLHLKSTPKKMLPDLLKNNFLDSAALTLVKHVDDIDMIWERLKAAYGDCKTLLDKKLSEIKKMEGLWKIKDPAKSAEALSKIVNCMRDLIALSKQHNIENELYYGSALHRIYKVLDDKTMTRWLSLQSESDWKEEVLWLNLIKFFEKDIKIFQQKVLVQGTLSNSRKNDSQQKGNGHYHTDEKDKVSAQSSSNQPSKCFICGEDDHFVTTGPDSKKLIQYFVCKKFVDMSPAERFAELRSKGLCFQCLFPGARQNSGRHKDGKCQHDFCCKHPAHDRYKRKLHVLVCENHKDDRENQELLEVYKQRCVLRYKNGLPSFSREIKISYHSSTEEAAVCDDRGIYMLQTIKVGQSLYTIFYDTGCGDFVSRFDAVTMIGNRAKKEFNGPIRLGGVGGVITESPHGIYSIKLPLANGNDAVMTGVCLSRITEDFPDYPIGGKVADDIKEAYRKSGGDVSSLPKVPATVGGNIDFMIGIKYLRYFPVTVFQLPSGLTIYQSAFKNHDGSRGVIGGPHEIFTKISNYQFNQQSFLSNQLKLFQVGYQVNPDVSSLSLKHDFYADNLQSNQEDNKDNAFISRKMRLFEQVELAGSEITYRCSNCRECKMCKSHDVEMVSIREEVEQEQIERSVHVDISSGSTIARLPLVRDAESTLSPNRDVAEKVLNQQVKKLSRSIKDKDDVINSERKLQQLGHVEFVNALPPDVQKLLESSKIHNYIPWRCVWKESSISTPCRMVFDASQPTSSGFALNDILGKGRNSMNKLVEVFIRWRSHKIGFHTDVAKMYNSVKLHQEDWCYQRYLWKENLEHNMPVVEKVIKTLIYGVKSSGNQAEVGLRKVADLSKKEYPEVNEIIQRDVYVDDVMSGESTIETAMVRADQLELVLCRGGFKLKGFTMSGSNPHESLSNDGSSINVAGMVWRPKDDMIWLDIKELNFATKQRGRKVKMMKDIPERLTRRQCASKVSEVFDLTGMLTPIIAKMKLDLHQLVLMKLDWDDQIPNELQAIWENNFEMIQEIKDIKYQRAIIPDDAANLKINLLCFGDASKHLLCVSIYARFERLNGTFSCQLVFARSRLVPSNMTLPRAELYAALVNTHSTEVVKRSFYKNYSHSVMFSDSQIVLHWMNNENRVLKQWVRNRIIDIQRFTKSRDWKYIRSKNMIADLGTRPGAKLNDVDQESEWINGLPWMHWHESEFPASTIEEIRLTAMEIEEAKKENHIDLINSTSFTSQLVPDDVRSRYQFSKYLVDPNRYSYHTVVRVLAYVMKFIRVLKEKRKVKRKLQNEINQNSIYQVPFLSDIDINCAEHYYFKKASEEVKEFMNKKAYEKCSMEKDGVLYYSGRILPNDQVSIVGKMTNVMRDLQADTFCVPLIEKHSPLAYSLINEIHWYNKDVKHAGVEVVWRYVLKKAFIFEGRNLVKLIKKNCQACRYLRKRSVEVVMGPVSSYNLTIAPCFYFCQVDLCGPFNAFSHHNKRATIKIWLAVFCCTTTSATSIKLMENYSSSAFIQAFIRFSCIYGYPKRLMSDEGSQLVSAFESMQLNYTDIKKTLYCDMAVEFDVCPVGGHNMNGKVERKIREVKSSLNKSVSNRRMSVMQWETVAHEIANCINDLPLCLGNVVSDFESMDLLTPNRLLLGRNNERSPVGSMQVSNNVSKIIEANEEIYNTWFENWLVCHVPKLMMQPKWFKTDRDLSKGDIVLFLKNESSICKTYQYGVIESVLRGKDNRIRKVLVKYQNHGEKVFRITHRAAREIVVIHPADELSIYEELYEMSM